MKKVNQFLAVILCLIFVISFSACGEKSNILSDNETTQPRNTEKKTVLGTGSIVFDFNVKDIDGNIACFEIHTDKTVVGDALSELDLIEGEEGPYGLYVKSVNGVTADYEKDGTYWAFFINGEMSSKGVDSVKIESGTTYSFEVSK